MENRNALLYTIPALRCPQSGATLVEWVRSGTDLRSIAVDQLVSWSGFAAGDSLLAAAQISDLDDPSREKLFKAAAKLLYPNIQASARDKKEYTAKVLAAAPEGPIRESVQQAITAANLPN
jgi:hypothetical protein